MDRFPMGGLGAVGAGPLDAASAPLSPMLPGAGLAASRVAGPTSAPCCFGSASSLQGLMGAEFQFLQGMLSLLTMMLMGFAAGRMPGPSAAGAVGPGAVDVPSPATSGGSSAPAQGSSGSAVPAGPRAGAPPAPQGQPHATHSARGTGYYPANNAMEGGFNDMKGHRLYTLQDYLAGKAPYVSVAMDKVVPYGSKVRIAELEKKYGRPIDFRVVDTGGAFRGKGFGRIDICTANAHASTDATINGPLTLQFG